MRLNVSHRSENEKSYSLDRYLIFFGTLRETQMIEEDFMINMKMMSHSKTMLLLLSAVFISLSACNKKSDDTSSTNYNPGSGDCTGYRYYNGTGYSPSVYDPSQGACIDPLNGQVYGQPVGQYLSFYSQNWDGSNNPSFQYVYSYNAYAPVKNMSVVNSSVYQVFLKKAMGVCDRGQTNGGTASCSQWANGGLDFVLQVGNITSSQARLTIRAWPQQNSYYNYNYSFPNAGQLLASFFGFPVFSNAGIYLNPLSLDLTLSPINNSAGFEGRAYGDYNSMANRSLMQLQVATGKLENSTFQYKFFFEGSEFARGSFQKCQTVDCGTMSFFGN